MMTPPPTGTLEVATLGPLGALPCEADGLGEVASAVGDGEAGGDVVAAAGEAEGEPLSASAEQLVSAAAPVPARASSPAARSTVRRSVTDASSAGCWAPWSVTGPSCGEDGFV